MISIPLVGLLGRQLPLPRGAFVTSLSGSTGVLNNRCLSGRLRIGPYLGLVELSDISRNLGFDPLSRPDGRQLSLLRGAFVTSLSGSTGVLNNRCLSGRLRIGPYLGPVEPTDSLWNPGFNPLSHASHDSSPCQGEPFYPTFAKGR